MIALRGKKTAVLRRIAAQQVKADSAMSGELKPVLNDFKGEPVTRRICETMSIRLSALTSTNRLIRPILTKAIFTAPGADRLLRPARAYSRRLIQPKREYYAK